MVRQLTSGLDLHEQKVIRDVEEHGCHIVYIEESDGIPGWAFSIGLYHNYRHAEIIIFGLKTEIMSGIINGVKNNIRSGKMYEAGFEYDDVLANYRCRFHIVQKYWYAPLLGFATWFYEGDEYPVLQCIWPDKQQNYPWSPLFPPNVKSIQPWLFRSDARDAKVEPFIRSCYGDTGVEDLLKIFDERAIKPSMTSMCSKHSYDPENWPFERPSKIGAFAQREPRGEKILFASREMDGTWLFCFSQDDTELEPCELCLGCLAANDPSLAEIADLPPGWCARRRTPEHAWERKPIPPDEV